MNDQLGPESLRDELSVLLDGARPTTAGDAIARARARTPTPFLDPRRGITETPARRIAIGALVAAAAVLVCVVVLSSSPPAPDHGVTLPASTSWRVAGYLDLPAWSSVNPVPGSDAPIGLECPSSSACYLATDTASVGPTLVRSSDGGATWADLQLPRGVASIASFSCVSATTCVVGAGLASTNGSDAAGRFDLLTTADSGATWKHEAVPSGLVFLGRISCVDSSHCVAWGNDGANGTDPVSLETTNGGRNWTVTSLPSPFVPVLVTCNSAENCVLSGSLRRSESASQAAILRTIDGGKTWTNALIPAQLSAVQPMSCVNASDCLAMAPNDSSLGPNFPTQFPMSDVHPSSSIASSDGGATWHPTTSAGLPTVVLYSVSCVTDSFCYVGGVGRLQPDAGYLGYGILLVSTDGSRSWTQVRLPKSVGTLWGIGYISCLPSGTCYALAAQAAPNSPTGSRLVILSDSTSTAPS